MDYSIIISITGILISLVSLYNSWQTRKESKERFAIETISDVCKIEPNYKPYGENKTYITISNESEYSIYDVIILQGLNTTDLYDGNSPCKAEYIRSIKGHSQGSTIIEHHGLGMSKFFVIGIFFRDHLNNEWFRDSYGKTLQARGYKNLLANKKIIFPPY
ncbi:hypothetical protein [Dialister invisus]|uniref:hypothetical protein n=1 Tax=Dialister invisus TaxID=218538 RepID=UPI00307C9522